MEALALSVEEATKVTPIGRTMLYRALKTGDLKGRKLGRKTIILSTDLQQYLERLEAYKQ